MLAQVTNRVECLFLDFLQDLIFGLVVLDNQFKYLQRVGFPSTHEMLESAHVHLLSSDRLNDLVMEKGYLPLILVESLWEVFEV